MSLKYFDSEGPWSKTPPLESVPVNEDFLEVFLDYLPRIPAEREIDFCIDFMPHTKMILIPPYHMDPT